MNRILAVGGSLIVGALIVLAFQFFQGRFNVQPPPPPCSGAQCQVDVDVTGTPPFVSVVPFQLRMSGGMSGNPKAIIWHLKNNDYEFKDDCVQFYDPTYTGQFSQLSGSGAQCHATDANTANPSQDPGWGYQIKVYKKGTSNWLTGDPWIVNG